MKGCTSALANARQSGTSTPISSAKASAGACRSGARVGRRGSPSARGRARRRRPTDRARSSAARRREPEPHAIDVARLPERLRAEEHEHQTSQPKVNGSPTATAALPRKRSEPGTAFHVRCTTAPRPCRAPRRRRSNGSVPQADEEHRDAKVRRAASAGRRRAPAEREVEVVAQPCRQRHVPATPELRESSRLVRAVEVLGQRVAQQPGRRRSRCRSSRRSRSRAAA